MSYKQQNQNSKSSQHLEECCHSVGPIDKILEVVHAVNKGTVINVFEKSFHLWSNVPEQTTDL